MSGIQMALMGVGGIPLSVSAPDASGSDSGFSNCGTVTAETTATATGGVPGYTYSWVRISGNTPSINDANTANPIWTDTVCEGFPSVSTWQVTVTDSVGSTATATITVTLTWASNN
jgi:hypothetical protein